MDEEELNLKHNMIKAKYAYLEKIMPKCFQDFNEYLSNNKKLYTYNQNQYIESDTNTHILSKNQEKKLRKIYHLLCLQYHPDKNKDDIESKNKMQMINELYKNKDLESLKQILDSKNIDIIYIKDLEQKIKYFESTCAYIHKYGSYIEKSIVESQFCTFEEKQKYEEQIKSEIIKLETIKKSIEILKGKLENINE